MSAHRTPHRLRRALSWLGHRSNRSALALSVLLGVAFAISSVYLARVQTLDEYRAIAVQLALRYAGEYAGNRATDSEPR